MNCPKCNVTLAMMDKQGVEVDYCPQCRGVWLDRGELDKLMERAGDHYSKRENYDRDFNKYQYGDAPRPAQQGYPYKKKKSFFSDFLDFD